MSIKKIAIAASLLVFVAAAFYFHAIQVKKVDVYFSNDIFDPEITCENVFPVERTVSKAAPARAALEELLKGPSEAERKEGYGTGINKGVRIQKLVIAGGTALADFSPQLEYQVGGSCRISLIRKQIEKTLLQFPSVSKVVISIDGRSEDILQP
jgi:spore germination protein GerM